MLRVQGQLPTCVMCGEPGVHASADACLSALRDALAVCVKHRELIGLRVIGRERKRIIGFKKPRASGTSGITTARSGPE